MKLKEGGDKSFFQAQMARQIKLHHHIVGRYEWDVIKHTIDVVKITGGHWFSF
jgi:hypothetical protein